VWCEAAHRAAPRPDLGDIIGPTTSPRVAGRRPRLPASGAQTGAAQAALGLVPSALGQGSNCPALQQRQLLCCLQLWRCAHGMHARMLWGGPAAETAGATVKQAHALFELALGHLRLPCAQTLHSCLRIYFKLLCKRAACSVAVCARALRSCGPKVLPRPEDAPTLFSDPGRRFRLEPGLRQPSSDPLIPPRYTVVAHGLPLW